MPSAGQAGTRQNVRTGAHKITIGGKVAGYTVGNLTLAWNTQMRKRFAAEWGTSPIATLVTGVQAVVTMRMEERTLTMLDILLGGIHGKAISGGRGVGRSGVLSSDTFGKSVTLHPLDMGAVTTRDITLYNAMPVASGDVELSDQGDQIYTVELHCNIDDTRTDGDAMIGFSEPTA